MMGKTMENLWAFGAQWAKFQKTSEKLPGAWSGQVAASSAVGDSSFKESKVFKCDHSLQL